MTHSGIAAVILTLCTVLRVTLAAEDALAETLSYNFKRSSDSAYEFSYETSNGLRRNETGEDIPSIHDSNANAALVKGSYAFTGADGKVYSVNYVADEAGFHPEGEHIQIPPFTPWIPGQPIDDGQYKEDTSGQYKPDDSGNYKPDNGENSNPGQRQKTEFSSGESILNAFRTTSPKPTSQIYLPSTPKYTSGENILDTFLDPKKIAIIPTVTPKYLPSSPTSPSYESGESILDAFRQSSRPTPDYLPSSPSPPRSTENPFDNDIIKKAFFNKPTPHPDLLLYSTPVDLPHGPVAFAKATGNRLKQRDTKRIRKHRHIKFVDIHPELKRIAGLH